MEAEDPLSQLADIHLPDAVSLWPPAPGWWLLAALVLLALLWVGRQLLRRLLVRRRLGAALQELDTVYATWQTHSGDAATRNQAGLDLLYGCNAILKRVALVYFPLQEVSALSGQAWLRFLDQTDRSNAFTAGAGQVLGDGTYRPAFSADAAALHALCRRWISARYLLPDARTKTLAPEAREVRA
jgi:hypothetical protein